MLDILIYGGLTLLALNLLVIAHELGHYGAARALGVRTETIALGFGPEITSRQIGLIRWQINWIPGGGYVRLSDRSFDRAPVSARFSIIAAGVTMNFLMASLPIFGHELALPQEIAVEQTVVAAVQPNSAAERAGLLPGDRILSATIGINETELSNSAQLIFLVRQAAGTTVELLAERDGRRFATAMTPLAGEKLYGITVEGTDRQVYRASRSVGQAARRAMEFNPEMIGLTYMSIEQSVRGEPVGLVGVIGTAKIGRDAVELAGWKTMIVLLATLSYCAGVMNLVPIPMLDGGKLALLSIENAFGAKLSPKGVAIANSLSLAALTAMVTLIALADIRRLIW